MDPTWNREFLVEAFGKFDFRVANVKFLTEKGGGDKPASYCFVEFVTEEEAVNAMLKCNGRTITNDPERRKFHLSFAKNTQAHTEYNIFVNNLSSKVDDTDLFKV